MIRINNNIDIIIEDIKIIKKMENKDKVVPVTLDKLDVNHKEKDVKDNKSKDTKEGFGPILDEEIKKYL